MTIKPVVINDRPQAQSLPNHVNHVHAQASEAKPALVSLKPSWDSFFIDGPRVTEDFMSKRADQTQAERGHLCRWVSQPLGDA